MSFKGYGISAVVLIMLFDDVDVLVCSALQNGFNRMQFKKVSKI
jgi:hypothetical protein